MKSNKKIKLALGTAVILIFGIGLACGVLFTRPMDDVVKYEGEVYDSMTFSRDIFYYDCNVEGNYEEDIKYPIEGAAWKMVYCNGDMFCISDELDDAETYYADDANYDWYAVIDTEDDTQTYPIVVTEEEMAYLNSIENMPEDTAIFFEEIEQMATLSKVSKDGIIKGVTELAYYEGSWYWRSEIIDESREEDGTWPEYVYKLPESMTESINDAIK